MSDLKVKTNTANIKNALTRSREELRDLHEFNQRIIDNVPVSILTLDKKGNITSVNRYFKFIAGPQGEVGRNIFNMPFFQREKLIEGYKNLLMNGIHFKKDNCNARNMQGEDKFINIIAVPLRDEHGNIDGAISMAMDNTEAVTARSELETLNVELEKRITQRTVQLDRVNKDLQKALDLKQQFIADASHELRTPLTVIQGNIDLTIREYRFDNKKVPEVFREIHQELEQMSNILTNLTLLTVGDKNLEKLKYEKVNLNLLVETAAESLNVLAKEKKIKIQFNKDAPDYEIMGDEDMLEKLILNIIRNAIKYSKEYGWVKIWLEPQNSDNIRIIVEDNGIGISAEDLPLIFERFHRGNEARLKAISGSGLGLAICKWIIEIHGGQICAESKLGSGSKFIIRLPIDYRKRRDNLFDNSDLRKVASEADEKDFVVL